MDHGKFGIDKNPLHDIKYICMKQIGLLSILPVILVLSCRSTPEDARPDVAEAGVPTESAPAQGRTEAGFDPAQITEEVRSATMAEVRDFIEGLNAIIRARDYDAWVSHLADSHYAEINSEIFLARRTEELFRRDQIVAQSLGRDPRRVQRRVLRSSRDFFFNVVVPARANDRIDDIAFVSETHILAFTVDGRGTRLVLYSLEQIDGKWMIIN